MAIWRALSAPSTLDEAAFAARYSEPLPPPGRAMQVYHLGHSLVGRDMPAMVAQLAAAAGYPEHGYHSQLGWGASLDQHWRGEVPGFAEENAHDRHCPVRAALTSGGYDAVVLTEMVELRDAIRWHDSARALADWARAARGGRRDVRVYLYETWHRLDDPAGWLARIDTDRGALWEGVLLRQAMARKGVGTVHVIPAGQVMAALVRAIEAGEVPGLSRRQDLFAVTPEGVPDPIHLNDIGAYAVALTHVAVLYGQSPEGLPHALLRADGTPATAPGPEAAAAMQRLVWRMVTGYRLAGVTR
ncbi:MAG: hypothetical protein ACK4GO_04365 [Gemmobacter sp.]